MLTEKGYSISLRTILRCRTALGWTFRGSAYCQLIREANKEKQFQWAQQHLGQSFEDVVWTDESTIQMESHRRFACRKRGEAPRPKPRYAAVQSSIDVTIQCILIACTCTCWTRHVTFCVLGSCYT